MIESTQIAQGGQRADVMRAIRSAASATGADFDYLVKTARRESNFDPSAKAGTSSATGLFQFTDSTWLRMVDRYGAEHGLSIEADSISVSGRKVSTDGEVSRADILALRNDPDLSARMAGELARENADILQKKIGRQPTSAELYTAHFMGPSDAARLIKAARSDAGGSAAQMFPSAAQANANVFKRDGVNLTASQLYAKLTGADVKAADTGKVAPAILAMPLAPAANRQLAFTISAGAAQLTSGLMNALFELQSENDAKRDQFES